MHVYINIIIFILLKLWSEIVAPLELKAFIRNAFYAVTSIDPHM